MLVYAAAAATAVVAAVVISTALGASWSLYSLFPSFSYPFSFFCHLIDLLGCSSSSSSFNAKMMCVCEFDTAWYFFSFPCALSITLA